MKNYILGAAIGLCLVAAAEHRADAETTLALVEDGALRRIPVQPQNVRLIARGANIALVCVEIDGSRHWAKPESWMAASAMADEGKTYHGGKVSGGGNGLGDIRDLPPMATPDCR